MKAAAINYLFYYPPYGKEYMEQLSVFQTLSVQMTHAQWEFMEIEQQCVVIAFSTSSSPHPFP
jgi:hypothetical protein